MSLIFASVTFDCHTSISSTTVRDRADTFDKTRVRFEDLRIEEYHGTNMTEFQRPMLDFSYGFTKYISSSNVLLKMCHIQNSISSEP